MSTKQEITMFNRDWRLINGKLYKGNSVIPETEQQALFVFKDGREIPMMLIEIPPAIKFDDRIFIRAEHDRTRYIVYVELDIADINSVSATVIKAELEADLLAKKAVMRGDFPLPKTPSKVAQFLENNPQGAEGITVDRRLFGFDNNEQK
jgi:hypothetical protein